MESVLQVLTSDIVGYFIINLIAVVILSYAIYFKRYHDREAVTAYILFNMFVFAVVVVFLQVKEGIDMGFGFGLFAVLSLITLRSETLTRTDITFFFGSLSIALINALSIENVALVIFLNIAILAVAYIFDHPKLLSGVHNMKVLLDHIPDAILEQSPTTAAELSKKFGVEVIGFTVANIDQVKDTVKLEIAYKKI